jgi:glycosyltransferase involved in cell wall biosynthesis
MLFSYFRAYKDFHTQLVRLIKQRRFDAVVLSHIISPVIPLLVDGIPIVFDYKDVYSASASAPFTLPLRPLVYWSSRLFEQILFSCPMTVVVPTPSMKAMLAKRFGISSSLITNGVNTRIFHPISEVERMTVRAQLGLHQDDFCVCYLGSIENWLDLETVISAVEAFEKARLILIGGPVRSPDYFKSILTACDKKGLGAKVITKGFLSQLQAGLILSAADAAIIPFRTDLGLSSVALPDKLFEYLASGVPVISTRLPDIASIFRDVVYFYGNPSDLLAILQHLDTLRRTRKLDAPGPALMKEYDWKISSGRYQQLLQEIIDCRKGKKLR